MIKSNMSDRLPQTTLTYINKFMGNNKKNHKYLQLRGKPPLKLASVRVLTSEKR